MFGGGSCGSLGLSLDAGLLFLTQDALGFLLRATGLGLRRCTGGRSFAFGLGAQRRFFSGNRSCAFVHYGQNGVGDGLGRLARSLLRDLIASLYQSGRRSRCRGTR